MMRQTLDAGLPELGLDLPESARQTLCDFGAAVIKQNEVMNLTAITQPDQVAKLHLLDSLTVLTGCKVERMLAGAEAPAAFQFLRLGYFAVDNKDATPEHLVFNRAVALKDSFKKA